MPPLASFRQAGAPVREPWFDSLPAQHLLEWERRVVIPKLTSIYGCNGLYLRPSRLAAAELSGNMLQCVISLYRDAHGFAGDLCCGDDALPLAGGSLSLVYAQHVFESSPDGVALAREVSRMLAPEGSVLVMLLSPFSPWRLRWHGHRLQSPSPAHLVRWMQDAGLTLQSVQGAGPVWPWWLSGPSQPERPRQFLSAVRAARLLLFRKHRAAVTPLRARNGIRLVAHPGPG